MGGSERWRGTHLLNVGTCGRSRSLRSVFLRFLLCGKSLCSPLVLSHGGHVVLLLNPLSFSVGRASSLGRGVPLLGRLAPYPESFDRPEGGPKALLSGWQMPQHQDA